MLLSDNVDILKGIGKKTSLLFNKLQVYTVWNLLHFFPRTYESLPSISTLGKSEAFVNMAICVIPTDVSLVKTMKKPRTILKGISEDNKKIEAVFFNMPYLKNTIILQEKYVLYGSYIWVGNCYKVIQPRVFSLLEFADLTTSMQPIYPLTKGLTNRFVRTLMKDILLHINNAEYEMFPERFLRQKDLYLFEEAYQQIHFPKDELSLLRARKRLCFDEFLQYLYACQAMKNGNNKKKNEMPMIPVAETKRLIENLPYILTSAQKKTWEEIERDLSSSFQMNRLIQGDVGSGKTIIAFLTILMAISNGYQTAFMAPMEILARQHFNTFQNLIKTYHLTQCKPCLLTGSIPAKQKKEVYEAIKNGSVNIVIGTHALIQEAVQYKNLALVITDEQHRFGVKQRVALSGKGDSVHILVMSATPIPRSLAMVLYGDLHVSNIDVLPAGRIPIKNCVVESSYRVTAHRFIYEEIKKGRQAYIICPMVQSNEEDELQNVTDYSLSLRKNIPEMDVRIGLIHGQMKATEKNNVMENYLQGNIDILVATTIVEVGMDVPNASVMMIENAERFGLASLHQLRGRVGRGMYQSYCIFLCATQSKIAKERLEVLNNTNDGFVIANADLKFRGPGNMVGIEQSGETNFKIANMYDDYAVLQLASATLQCLFDGTLDFSEKEKEKLLIYLRENGKIATYGEVL